MKNNKIIEIKIQYVFFLLITMFPLLIKGIICNDELMLRLWGQQGLDTFFKITIFNENIGKGRILGILGNIKFLDYISESKYVYGVINVVFIITAVALFAYFVFQIVKEKAYCIFLGIFIVALMPVTFEPSVPSQFVVVVLQPMILLELSMIFYMKYLEICEMKYLAFSLVLFFWAMCLYEFIITYALMYFIIYLIKGTDFSIKKTIRDMAPFVSSAVLYLALYIVQGRIAPTNYSGNTIQILSVFKVFRVIGVTVLTSFPGFYTFFSTKYRYLFNYYKTKETLEILFPIVAIFALVFLWILVDVIKQGKEQGKGQGKIYKKKFIYMIIVSGMYVVLPVIPNSLTSLYQETVSFQSFVSIPVSIYMYFALCVPITYIIWKLVTKCKKVVSISIICVIVVLGTVQQTQNYVVAKEQSANFERIIQIEKLLELEYWNQYSGTEIVAPSLYETYNAMAVEDGHWTQYANIYHSNISVDREARQESYLELTMQDDNSFYFDNRSANILITKCEKNLHTQVALRDIEGQYKIYFVDSLIQKEKGYNLYSLKKIK